MGELAERLRARQIELKATYRECGRFFDIDPTVFRRWALGLDVPPARHLKRVREFLACDSGWLIDAVDAELNPPTESGV